VAEVPNKLLETSSQAHGQRRTDTSFTWHTLGLNLEPFSGLGFRVVLNLNLFEVLGFPEWAVSWSHHSWGEILRFSLTRSQK
jgi:hypothetical protein